MTGPILFVVALGWEEAALSRSGAVAGRTRSGIARLSEIRFGARTVHVLRTGVGGTLASAGVRWAIDELRPVAIVSTGCAGALVPGLDCGDVVVARDVVSTNGDRLATSPQWSDRYRLAAARAGLEARDGTLLSSDRILSAASDKSAAAERTGAVAVDMEAAAALECAQAAGIEAGAARVILDRSDLVIPAEIAWITTPAGRASARRLFAAIARRPAVVSGLLRLGAAVPPCRAALSRLHQELFRTLGPC
jgi:adenosylhomocysteine nucleosidase